MRAAEVNAAAAAAGALGGMSGSVEESAVLGGGAAADASRFRGVVRLHDGAWGKQPLWGAHDGKSVHIYSYI